MTTPVLRAEDKSKQLLELLDGDPSLLLEDPVNEEKKVEETQSQENKGEEVAVQQETKTEPKEESNTKPTEKVEAKPVLPVLIPKLIAKPIPAPAPVPVPVLAPKVEPEVTPVVVQVKESVPVVPAVVSQLKVVPGVNDIAIIFSNNQFYPSRIQMKATLKSRLIFTTTDKKPVALVFSKQKIHRWLASETKNMAEEYREISPSRVAEVQFDAEPGIYQFYDAISGASGEIQVE